MILLLDTSPLLSSVTSHVASPTLDDAVVDP